MNELELIVPYLYTANCKRMNRIGFMMKNFYTGQARLIRTQFVFPLNMKENLADEWLWINRFRPVDKYLVH